MVHGKEAFVCVNKVYKNTGSKDLICELCLHAELKRLLEILLSLLNEGVKDIHPLLATTVQRAKTCVRI
jgi:hypothetical protein